MGKNVYAVGTEWVKVSQKIEDDFSESWDSNRHLL